MRRRSEAMRRWEEGDLEIRSPKAEGRKKAEIRQAEPAEGSSPGGRLKRKHLCNGKASLRSLRSFAAAHSGFGPRASDFLRPSNFGLLVCINSPLDRKPFWECNRAESL